MRTTPSWNMNGSGQPAQGQGPGVIDVFGLIVHAVACTAEVFIRERIGSRYLDKQSAIALLIIPCFALTWPGEDPKPLLCFLGAYFLATVLVQGASFRRRLRGLEAHSRYNGFPRLLKLPPLRHISEEKAKAVLEPLFVISVGMLTLPASLPLGSFVMLAGLALFLVEGIRRGLEQQRMLDIKDALADQRLRAERFRSGGW